MNLIERTRTFAATMEAHCAAMPPGIVAYNPLAYAWQAHARWLSLFDGPRRIVFAGMNPGPWGMVQTGVPFGNVETASKIIELAGDRAWLSLVEQPAHALDERPIRGFVLGRDEVSGRRFWSGLAPLWATAEDDKIKRDGASDPDAERFGNRLRRMLGECFVMNLCPLAFFDTTRKAANVTPDKLPQPWRDRLVGVSSPCAAYFRLVLDELRPEVIVVMGGWVERTVSQWMIDEGRHTARIVRLLHPSPASPLANRGWAEQAARALRAAGVVP